MAVKVKLKMWRRSQFYAVIFMNSKYRRGLVLNVNIANFDFTFQCSRIPEDLSSDICIERAA